MRRGVLRGGEAPSRNRLLTSAAGPWKAAAGGMPASEAKVAGGEGHPPADCCRPQADGTRRSSHPGQSPSSATSVKPRFDWWRWPPAGAQQGCAPLSSAAVPSACKQTTHAPLDSLKDKSRAKTPTTAKIERIGELTIGVTIPHARIRSCGRSHGPTGPSRRLTVQGNAAIEASS